MIKGFLVLLLLIILAGCAGGDGGDPPRGGGAVVSGSCVQMYSTETLRNQNLAFDGELLRISEGKQHDSDDHEGDTDFGTLSFKVNTWYRGGSESEVTVKSPIPIGEGVVSSTDFPAMRVGNRYLVSGTERTAHSCGFTRDYSEEEARAWAEAFSAPPR